MSIEGYKLLPELLPGRAKKYRDMGMEFSASMVEEEIRIVKAKIEELKKQQHGNDQDSQSA